jgi:heat shock protein HspQ
VAERNLELDKNSDPITHPMLSRFFSQLDDGRYIRNDPGN